MDYSCLTDLYKYLVLHLHKMMVWCHPSVYATTEDIHSSYSIRNIANWLPCGRAHVAVPQNRLYVRWLVQVIKLFYINITFLRFEVLDSGTQCSASSFKMAEYLYIQSKWHQRPSWVYCGQRRPWTELIQSNILATMINRVELRNHFNISFIYYAIERSKFLKYEDHYILCETLSLTENILSLSLKEPDLDYVKWVVNVRLGFQVRLLYLRLNHPRGVLNIYDGPKEAFPLHSIIEPTNITQPGTISRYFTLFMELKISRTQLLMVGKNIFLLNYTRERAIAQRLLLNTSTMFQSGDFLLHQLFSFNTTTEQYPNISLEVRQLEGWNEGGCNLGGFAILQNISFHDKDVVASSGPYCPGGSLGQPFISEYGFSSLVLNNYSYLVLYSYGSAYHIDVDILVISSECEGLVDPVLPCLGLVDIDQLDYFQTEIPYESYKYTCLYTANLEVYAIRLYRLQRCLVVQSVHYGYKFQYDLEILNSGNVQLNLTIPTYQAYDGSYFDTNELILSWGDQTSGIHRVISMVNSTYLRLREVSATRLRHHQTLSFHHSSLLLKIEPHEVPGMSCMMLNESSHSVTNYNGYSDALATQLVCLCALGIYSTPTLYTYTLIPRYMLHAAQTAVVYFEISGTNCSRFNRTKDILRVTIRDIMTQSLYVGKEGLQCSVPDVSVNIFYERHGMCSRFIIRFQRYKLKLFALKNK